MSCSGPCGVRGSGRSEVAAHMGSFADIVPDGTSKKNRDHVHTAGAPDDRMSWYAPRAGRYVVGPAVVGNAQRYASPVTFPHEAMRR